jgi:hypothetical protein
LHSTRSNVAARGDEDTRDKDGGDSGGANTEGNEAPPGGGYKRSVNTETEENVSDGGGDQGEMDKAQRNRGGTGARERRGVDTRADKDTSRGGGRRSVGTRGDRDTNRRGDSRGLDTGGDVQETENHESDDMSETSQRNDESPEETVGVLGKLSARKEQNARMRTSPQKYASDASKRGHVYEQEAGQEHQDEESEARADLMHTGDQFQADKTQDKTNRKSASNQAKVDARIDKRHSVDIDKTGARGQKSATSNTDDPQDRKRGRGEAAGAGSGDKKLKLPLDFVDETGVFQEHITNERVRI